MYQSLWLLWIFFVFLSETSWARRCTHEKTGFDCLEYVDNYDGDTITFNIPRLHPLLGNSIKVRLNGLDTPEIRSQKPCEKKLAYFAKDYVKALLVASNVIELKNAKRGKYFRIIGDLFLDGKNLGELLLEKHLAVPYDGGHKDQHDWCQVNLESLDIP